MDVQFTFNPTVSINVTGDLTIAELTPGNALDSNIITVTAGSNEANGYTLYSTVGSSTNNYTDLRLSSSNTTNVFTNLSTNKTSLYDFDNNTWGYSYSTDSGTTWQSGDVGSATLGYNGLPIYNASDNTTGVVLAKTDGADETVLKFKIGAKAASTQASGTYTNTVNFISIAKVVTTNYTLNYNANAGSDTVTGMPANISDGTTNTSAITLFNTTPVREGYAFKGWCTADTSETACSDGTLYGPGRIYIFENPGTTTTVNLHAIWQPPKTYMQNITPARLAALLPNVGDTTTLYDNRDETAYTVGKLADNNYWMLENLAFDLVDSNVQTNLSSITTNASDETLSYLLGSKTGTTSDQYPTAAAANWTSSYSYSAPLVATSGSCDDAYCVDDPENGKWSYDSVTPATINGVTSIYQGKIGAYYNYCAASAGSYCWGDGAAYWDSPSSDPDASTLQDVKEDICPAGWRMPTSSSAGEYQNLYAQYSGASKGQVAAFQTALATPLSGSFGSGTARYQGDDGYFWASTWYNTNRMYLLDVYSNDVYPSSYSDRDYGRSVRCLLSS